jgi:hypothetical protein
MTAKDAELEPEMSDDEHQMWEEAAKDLTPPKTLSRMLTQQEFIVDNVSKVGTLLAGVSGITAAITITRTTWYWHGIPVIPVCTLITTALAGLAVLLSLIARRPAFEFVNINDAYDIRRYFQSATASGKRMLTTSWVIFLAAILSAVATAVAAGIGAITEPPLDPTDGPRNEASLSATAGEKGAVTVKVGGSITNIPDDQFITIKVTSNPQRKPGQSKERRVVTLISTKAYPNGEGTAAIDLEASVPIGGSRAKAIIEVRKVLGRSVVETFPFTTAFSQVPAPAAAEPAAADPAGE